MAQVLILNHGYFVHKPSGVTFQEAKVTLDGKKQFLGVADVDLAVAVEHFIGHPAFKVFLSEAEAAANSVPAGTELGAVPAGDQPAPPAADDEGDAPEASAADADDEGGE